MKIKKLVIAPLGLAGASIGMGLVGNALDSQGLQEGGAVAGKFIAPAISISAGGYLINQIKKIPRKKFYL